MDALDPTGPEDAARPGLGSTALSPAPAAATPLALLEVLDRDGRVRQSLPVHRWPLRIGRALDNDLVLDDAHAAPHHLQLGPDADGALAWQVGPTLNGVQCGRATWAADAVVPVAAPAPLGAGSSRPVVVVGATRLRLRLPDDPLAAERPLHRSARVSRTLAATLALAALSAAQLAVGIDPGGTVLEWLGLAVAPPFGLALWCVGWGVASKLFQHRFEFWPHWAVAVRGALAYLLVAMLLPQVAASLSWVWLSRLDELVLPLVLALTVAAHARIVLPTMGRREAVIAGGLLLGLVGLDIARNEQRLQRPFEELYMATLPLPALRLAGGVSPKDFVAGAAGLRGRLAEHVDDESDAPDAEE